MAAAAAFAEVDQCLQWIGFTDVQHHNSIIAEGGFNGLNDFFDVTETDIHDIVRKLDLAMCVSPSSNGSKMRSLWTNQMKS